MNSVLGRPYFAFDCTAAIDDRDREGIDWFIGQLRRIRPLAYYRWDIDDLDTGAIRGVYLLHGPIVDPLTAVAGALSGAEFEFTESREACVALGLTFEESAVLVASIDNDVENPAFSADVRGRILEVLGLKGQKR